MRFNILGFDQVKACRNKLTIDENVYKHMQGYPANIYGTLSSFSGYVEVGEIHFDPMNADIYQDEITEIVELLQKGVIFWYNTRANIESYVSNSSWQGALG